MSIYEARGSLDDHEMWILGFKILTSLLFSKLISDVASRVE
jgi:hypothetical protein